MAAKRSSTNPRNTASLDARHALLGGGAFSWSLGQSMVRRLGEVGGLTTIAWVSIFAAPQLFVFSLVFGRDHLAAIASAGATAASIPFVDPERKRLHAM